MAEPSATQDQWRVADDPLVAMLATRVSGIYDVRPLPRTRGLGEYEYYVRPYWPVGSPEPNVKIVSDDRYRLISVAVLGAIALIAFAWRPDLESASIHRYIAIIGIDVDNPAAPDACLERLRALVLAPDWPRPDLPVVGGWHVVVDI